MCPHIGNAALVKCNRAPSPDLDEAPDIHLVRQGRTTEPCLRDSVAVPSPGCDFQDATLTAYAPPGPDAQQKHFLKPGQSGAKLDDARGGSKASHCHNAPRHMNLISSDGGVGEHLLLLVLSA
ncbi:hypothetical protein MTO96_000832 [Rhipicephalus appendiculatus]